MKIVADLHIHGKHSRATSRNLDLEQLQKYARIKGVDLLGTGDFTHPEWIKLLKSELAEDETGILKSSSGYPFVLQTEISLVYSQGGKGRRIHHLILAPGFEVVDQITEFLLTKGRIDYDGRPIFGMSSIELAEKLNEISKDCELIPAHAWTPWFGVFGSQSGFDSLKECFEDKTNLIHAIETGMSSDPAMNWMLSELDGITLTSNSDLHSFWPWRMGREANVFEMKHLTYKNILSAIREREGFVETIEVDPGYGKYHFDGHRKCGTSMSPSKSKKAEGICPRCKSKLTIGVLNRVCQLADREPGFKPKGAVPFKTLLPLSELISAVLGASVSSKKTWEQYNSLISRFGKEMNVLMEADRESISKASSEEMADVIIRNRESAMEVVPGYDGVYGELAYERKSDANSPQKFLGSF